MMKNSILLFLPLILLVIPVSAQTVFIPSNAQLGEQDQHSAVPVAIADMNGDFLDDIVTLDDGHILNIQYQTPDPTRPFVRYEVTRSVDVAEQNDICIADFNNDGLNDIFTIGSYDKAKVFYANKGSYTFTLKIITGLSFFSQGASSGDFNQDGWVDVVMLNDNAANFTLINDGTGNLVKQDLFDFITVPPSDNSGNYGSVYSDFDMDDDLDLYIAKCRQGVNDPTDPRRINILFVNDGDGNYTQNAKDYGLAIGHQTWTADFGDVDNDGDLDCFMTQHDVICELYENINNDTFINITPTTGLDIGGIPLQGMFNDFDNDGYQDILVAGDRVDFWHNNGDKTFTKETPFSPVIFGSYALGDLNDDGFTDVYASRVIPFNNPDPLREDVLFLNQKNDNHWIGLHLYDNEENHSAIGAMALLYGPWGVQIKEVRGGEQYGVSNSHSLIFGLGDETTFDSLVIRWPDKSRETFKGLQTDQYVTLIKNECFEGQVAIFDALKVLCNNDSLILRADPLVTVIEWNTGETSDSIIVKEPGLYYLKADAIDSCPFISYPIEVTTDPDSIKPVLSFDGGTLLCSGETVELTVSPGLSYAWSNGETTQTIQADVTGEYFAEVHGYCRDQFSDTLSLTFLLPDAPVVENDTFLPDETATLHAVGDSIVWYSDENGGTIIGTGSELVLDGLDDTTTVYAVNLGVIEGLDYNVGQATQVGSSKYNATFVNGGLQFEVYEPIVLEQVTVYTDSIGERIIEITDSGVFNFQKSVVLDSGKTVVDLGVSLDPGAYTIGTNTNQNQVEFGTNSPYLWRSSEGVLYPYEIPTVMAITSSTFGGDFYYYFYDWKIATQDEYCQSVLVPVTAVLDLGVAVDPVAANLPLKLLPNPTTGLVKLILDKNTPVQLELIQADGRVIPFTKDALHSGNSITLDLSGYAPGIYVIRAVQDGKSFVGKVVRL
jgi:hypothetical protein